MFAQRVASTSRSLFIGGMCLSTIATTLCTRAPTTTTASSCTSQSNLLLSHARRLSTSTASHSTLTMVPPVIVPAKKEHKNTVIFLHGLGDSGDGWSSVFETEIREPHTKYICPSSDSRPVTLNMGMRMPAWFDLHGLSADSPEDDAGIEQAKVLVHAMLDKEIEAGVPSNKIVLGGFSMGGALALYAGLTYPKKLAGIVGLSSFLIQRTKVPGSHTANKDTPIFLGHGSNDFLVPLTFGQLSEQLIKAFNPNVQLRVYPGMAHSSSAAELSDVKDFLKSRFA